MSKLSHRLALLAVCIASAIGGSALAQAAVTPSTQVSVQGDVRHARRYDLAGLQALPAVTQTVSFGSGSGPQNHTYTGTSLWGVLDAAGIKTDPDLKNDILGKYVLATGTDGYRVAFSMGELNPGFGNRTDLLAYAETINGVSAPLSTDGVARVTAPGDVKGGRYVSNLASLAVGSAAPTVKGAGGVSTQFSVSGDVTHTMNFDLAALKALPIIHATVGSTTYTGASFWDLLNSTVGLATKAAVKNDLLGMIIVATGSDGYKAAFSLGELSPDFGHQPDLIAYEANGVPLSDNGFARIIVPNDIRGGRAVSNLVGLDVFHAVAPVPEPSSMALGLLGLTTIGWKLRQRRGSRSMP